MLMTFEDGTTQGWAGGGPNNQPQLVENSTAQAYGGTHSLRIVCAGTTNYEGAACTVSGLEPGKAYQVTARVLYLSGTTAVELGTRMGEPPWTPGDQLTVPAPGPEWQQLQGMVTAGPTGLVELSARTSAVTGAAEFYLDDVSVLLPAPVPTMTRARRELAAALTQAGLPAFDSMPATLTVPAVVIAPDQPYLTPNRVGGKLTGQLRLRLGLFASAADNQAALEVCEQLAEQVLAALPHGVTVLDLSAPRVEAVAQGAAYLMDLTAIAQIQGE